MQNLALKANWPGPLKKAAAKKIANEFVASRWSSEFDEGLKAMSTLYNMSKWVQKERFGLPGYLLRTCPSSLQFPFSRCFIRAGLPASFNAAIYVGSPSA